MLDHPLAPLVALPGVADAVAQARAAADRLAARAAAARTPGRNRDEARVRRVLAGAGLDGIAVREDAVRAVLAGGSAISGPTGAALSGLVRVDDSVTAALRDVPHDGGVRSGVPFPQLLARWHALAVGPLGGTVRPATGRPRTTEQPGDLRGLGVAPVGDELTERLGLLNALVGDPGQGVPGVVLAAVVHGELLALRPFAAANGAVARAASRWLLAAHGVEPTGLAVPEVRWAGAPMVYLSAAAGFATGEPARVAAWLRECCAALVAGTEVVVPSVGARPPGVAG